MHYETLLFFRRVTAWFMSVLASLGIISSAPQEKPVYGEENTVSAYSAEHSDYSLNIDAANEIHDISELLYGVFFEDINFAADGGLYAEMVINRSFEYKEYAQDDELHGWSGVGESEYAVIKGDLQGGLNENNTNYLRLENAGDALAGVANRGFLDGMAIESGITYDFSVYAKSPSGYSGEITVRLVAGGETAAEGVISSVTSGWSKYSLELTSSVTANEDVYLQLLIESGEVMLDMVSLFPPTYKDHGLRTDLAQAVAELEPAFIRFPGGCVIEGYDDETDYSWKDSIGVGSDGLPLEFEGGYGDVAARPLGINLWTNIGVTDDPLPCFMSYGLGFFEYFLFAEDIGAVGVPVLSCGLYCQMRGRGPVDMDSERFEQYVQDMVDLIEFCRGPVDSTWGKVRASLGHPEPFELKYIGIGNENEGEDYFERYEAFLERFNEEKAKNPQMYEGIELIYSSGAFDATGSEMYKAAYDNAYEYINENGIDGDDYAGIIDQHYYKEPEWFLKNADYYDEDNYKRSYDEMTDTIYGGGIKVFLGEYAARSNTLKAALAEAAYMTGLERNGDIVKMAAYAPLFGNLTATHWSPDLIWFNNSTVTRSINYYMQQLFSTNAGTRLISSELDGAQIADETLHGMVGLGTWYTRAYFDNVKVVSNASGKTLGRDNFTVMNFWWNWYDVGAGDWEISKGKLYQTVDEHPYNELGASAYFGDPDWSDYTYTFEATKIKGAEGFYIPFLIEDESNMFVWNIGGWGNEKTGLQRVEDGVKTGLIPGTQSDFTVEDGATYQISITVSGTRITGSINGEQMLEYDASTPAYAEAYHVVSTDESGDIIVKLVNVTGEDRTFAVNIGNAEIASAASVYQVSGDSLDNDNILGAQPDCTLKEFELEGVSESFNLTVPQYSATVVRLHRAR